MKTRTTTHPALLCLSLLIAALVAVLPAAAQEGRRGADRWDDGEPRGVTLHRDLDFTGASQTFARDVPDLRRTRVGNDNATSVSVSRGCTARLYRDTNYRGAFTEVTRDLRDLRGSKVGDDSATSLRVRCRGRGWDDGGVTLHRDLAFNGVHETFRHDVPDLRKTRFGDDHATSVTISPGCTARLYRDLNFRGEYSEIRDDVADLRKTRVGNDTVTSLEVQCRSPRRSRGGRGAADWDDDDWRDDDWGDEEWDDQGWEDAPADRGRRGVTLHRDLEFTGASETFAMDVPDLRRTRVGNDNATSVSISRGCTARLYRDRDFKGEYTEVTRSIADLRGSRVGNDSATSLQVRCAY